jgi:hypothetical protein
MGYLFAAGIQNEGGVATLEGLEGAFESIIGVLFSVAGIILFIMLIVGGVNFMTSGGDPKGLEAAKKTLTYALVGMLLVALGYLVLVFVSDFTGNTNILNFDIRI